MADVVGILGFALHAAHKIYNVIESIKDAPSDIQTLRDDALQVHGFLHKLLDSNKEGELSSALCTGDLRDGQIDSLVKKAEIITKTVDKFIKKTTTERESGTYEVKKLKWPLYAGEAKKLSEQFKAFYSSLTAVYTISTSTNVDLVLSNQRAQQAVLARHDTMLHAIFMLMVLQVAAREQREGRSMLFDELCAVEARWPAGAIPHVPAGESSPPSTSEAGPSKISAAISVGDGHTEACASGFDGPHEELHGCDYAITSRGSISTTGGSAQAAEGCSDSCPCFCHSPFSDIRPIPSWLNPWLGKLNIPRPLVASQFPSLFPCSNPQCFKTHRKMQTVRYYPPAWFAHVEASIRFEAFPIHFCIQTPRVVTSLIYLQDIGFDEFRLKLSTREITLHDMDPDGTSVLHRLLYRECRLGDAFDLITYVLAAGIPQDWQYKNMTAVEIAAYNIQRYPDAQRYSQSLDLNIVKPLLRDSLDEASRTLDEKLGRSDVHAALFHPHRDVASALVSLRSVLALPRISAQVNQLDSLSWPPLTYATRAFPEAVELLLQAGASPRRRHWLLHLRGQGQWKAVSALVRAGCPTDEKDKKDGGRTPLHDVVADRKPNYRHALELVRHGSHLLDWDVRDKDGETPLESAESYAEKRPDDKRVQDIRDLYRTRSVPPHAQYISSFDGERLVDAGAAALRPRISLIEAGLTGHIASIGRLVSAGAMINERDDEGRTLLHLAAVGSRIPRAYDTAKEVVRHGGYGVDWDAKTVEGRTALEIAEEMLKRRDLDGDTRREVGRVRELLKARRLPPGESYVFPCMDPDFCRKCESLRCTCIENDVPGMPGAFLG